MTPAIKQAQKAGIWFAVHEYQHDPNTEAYGLEAAQALGLDPAQVFKTLLVCIEGNSKKMAVGIVPVALCLDFKQMAKALKVKSVEMANPKDAERLTGYLVGGISPLGQKKRLKTVIDATAQTFNKIYVSGGKRGLDIGLDPNDLAKLLNATFSDLLDS